MKVVHNHIWNSQPRLAKSRCPEHAFQTDLMYTERYTMFVINSNIGEMGEIGDMGEIGQMGGLVEMEKMREISHNKVAIF